MGFEIKDIDKEKEPHFLHSRKEIFINSNIKCMNKPKCQILSDSDAFKEQFEMIATNKLRIYFSEYLYNLNAEIAQSKLEFKIASHGTLTISKILFFCSWHWIYVEKFSICLFILCINE